MEQAEERWSDTPLPTVRQKKKKHIEQKWSKYCFFLSFYQTEVSLPLVCKQNWKLAPSLSWRPHEHKSPIEPRIHEFRLSIPLNIQISISYKRTISFHSCIQKMLLKFPFYLLQKEKMILFFFCDFSRHFIMWGSTLTILLRSDYIVECWKYHNDEDRPE